ncbi:MAG: Gfo/Idh/MocA family oxidoreductase [Ignavibacteriales bacterium]|nr:Gfo/Idh/MocA family oxidoreductase [Ignavibacteriales bacterium]
MGYSRLRKICRTIHFYQQLRLIRKSSVTAFYSRDLNRAKSLAEKFGVQNTFDNYDDFLKSDIDAVFVASANVHHYEQVIKAARSWKKYSL